MKVSTGGALVPWSLWFHQRGNREGRRRNLHRRNFPSPRPLSCPLQHSGLSLQMFAWNVLSPLVQEGGTCSFFETQPKGHHEALLNL